MIIKCKMCGGDLHPEEGSTICECEFCGTVQTIPLNDVEKKTNLFNRANRLRMNAEFDKASAVYESIVAEFPEEAEAYWGLCLCAYGIEYVDDPGTGEKKPTCHRTLPTSIMEDPNFEQACDNADAIARRVYREEAKTIDQIQKDILSIVSSEEPYDVFICYKETADEGGRTEDSVLAEDIYDALTGKGLKVFFARITLEDKLGQQYEPYIYAALSSAKVMLAIGTKYEYFDAVWVKNEWMRYLAMMKSDKQKTLIPCYKNLDAYDMPKEFKNLQAQDMSKLGWLQDLSRGVVKLCGRNGVNELSAEVLNKTQALIEQAKYNLENKEWDKANKLAEEIISLNPKNGEAYLILLMSERHWSVINEFTCTFLENSRSYINDPLYKHAIEYGCKEEENLKRYAELYEEAARENSHKQNFAKGFTLLCEGKTIEDFKTARLCFTYASGFKGAEELKEKCEEKIVAIRKKNQIDNSNYTSLNNSNERRRGNDEIIGKSITFGRYVQNENKVQPIEWMVIDKQENKILLLSKYILDFMSYDTRTSDDAPSAHWWKDSDIRSWLNHDFLNKAFSEAEKQFIVQSPLNNARYGMILETKFDDKGNIYITENVVYDSIKNFYLECYGDDPTVDMVFMLNLSETRKYFQEANSRKCLATEYVRKKDLEEDPIDPSCDDKGYCKWMMRSTSEEGFTYMTVEGNGEIGSWDLFYKCGIRPAMWIKSSIEQ